MISEYVNVLPFTAEVGADRSTRRSAFVAVFCGETVTVLTARAAPAEFLACTVKVNVPAVVGVPVSRPEAARASPGGSVPATTVTVGAGDPVTVYVES